MEPKSTVNPYDYLQLVRNSDGSITRLFQFPTTAAAPDPRPPSRVLTRDVELHSGRATWLRVFLPLPPDNAPAAAAAAKMPVIVYFHGGGFIVLSASSSVYHDFCSEMALQLSAVVVSVDYRLSPEHRLPAAYDDASDALRWLRRSDDEWIRRFADLSSCFLMGTSAGGNIAYCAGLRPGDLEPVKIRGLVLHHPFFGGSARTGSEIRLVDDSVIALSVTDLMWELSLPIGADRDHEYSNPAADGGSERFGEIKKTGCRILMFAGLEDPLVDRQAAAAEMWEREGVSVEAVFGEGDCHGVELGDPTKAKALFGVVKKFMAR